MEKVRFDSGIKKIEVNDAGEYITINTGDATFYKRFKETYKWLQNAGGWEKEIHRKKAENNLSVMDEADAYIDGFVETSEEMNRRLDSLFGEGCLKKAFPDTEIPGLDLALEFVSGIMPFVEKAMNDRNAKLGNKYNGSRKGANSK